MAQNIIVALLVAGCFVYALWTLTPKGPRGRLATALLKLPLPTMLHKPLTAAARVQGGCGCDSCDRSSAATNPAARDSANLEMKAEFQPVTFVRGRYGKKFSR